MITEANPLFGRTAREIADAIDAGRLTREAAIAGLEVRKNLRAPSRRLLATLKSVDPKETADAARPPSRATGAPKGKIFVPWVAYDINLRGQIRLGPIGEAGFSAFINENPKTGGSVIGMLATPLLASVFDNLVVAEGEDGREGGDYDLDDALGGRWEAKSFHAGQPWGANITRSSLRPGGRKGYIYDEAQQRAWMDRLSGFVIVDRADFPTLHVVGVTTAWAHEHAGPSVYRGRQMGLSLSTETLRDLFSTLRRETA